MNRRKMTVGAKLGWMSACMLLNLALVGGMSYWSSLSLMKEMYAISSIQMSAVKNMTLVDMAHDGIRASVYQNVIDGPGASPERTNELRAGLQEQVGAVRHHLQEIERLPLGDEARAAIAPVLPKLDTYIRSAGEISEAALAGKLDKARAAMPAFQKVFDELADELSSLANFVEDGAKKADVRGGEFATRTRMLSASIVLIGMLTGGLLSFLIIRGLKKDLSAIVSKLTQESWAMATTASTLKEQATQLASATTEQSSALQETAASIDEINAMVKKTDEGSRQLGATTRQSNESARQGQSSIGQMLSEMDSISRSQAEVMSQVEAGNQQIAEIVKVIGEIGNKTKVINDIVFQTKLLSFNASVEAARAGEHGKGFAVVAEEVGNLAAMSGTAAKEISDMLESSMSRVSRIVEENRQRVEGILQQGKARLDQGAKVAQECGVALNEIVRHASQVDGMTTEIETAIREQSQGIQEISRAIQLLDQATHQNAGTSQATSTTSEEILERSRQLNQIVAALERMISQASVSTRRHDETGAPPAQVSSSPDSGAFDLEVKSAA